MRGTRLAARLARNRHLAQEDAAQRCVYCRDVAAVKHQVFGDPRMYCSPGCATAQRAYDDFLAERRRLRALLEAK